MKIFKYTFVAILLLIIGAFSVSYAQILSPDQELWLSKRNRIVIVRPERNYPPFDFISYGSTGRPQGLGVDYLELIAKKINLKLQYTEPSSLANILDEIKSGKNGLVIGVTPTREREDFLLLSKPFIEVPAVIVVRKDFPTKKSGLTLADFTGKRVAVGDSYGVESYINDNYKKIIVEPVSDDEVGLQKLLLGEVDAAIMDVASLSYYTANKALSYVVVGGQTGFDYKLSFGVSKNDSQLISILNIALGSISPQEQSNIKDKWINLPKDQKTSKLGNLLNSNIIIIIGIIIVGGIVFIFTILIIMRSFKRFQFQANSSYKNPKTDIDILKEELKELEHASSDVSSELEHIKALEKNIADKINKAQ